MCRSFLLGILVPTVGIRERWAGFCVVRSETADMIRVFKTSQTLASLHFRNKGLAIRIRRFVYLVSFL
jgi:hypothetical protein